MPTNLWSRTPPGRFLVRVWDGSCVVFDLLSNDTHACDPLTTRLVQELDRGPADLDRLSRAAAATLGCRCDAQLAEHALAALQNLERLGIAEHGAP